MIGSAVEELIECTPDRLFGQLTDHSRWDRWLTLHEGWPDGPPATVAEGARFRQRLGQLGVHDTVSVTILENRAPAVFVVAGTGTYGADIHLAFHLEPAAQGHTRLRAEAAVVGNLVLPLATLASRSLDKALKRSIRRLADLTRSRT